MTSQKLKQPELLVPAGDLEKLETAVRFGADAVYIGGGEYSLRAAPTSFTIQELKKGVRFAHERGCKVYLALNIFAFDDDLGNMMTYLTEAIKYGIDAVIVSDPGVISLIQQLSTNIKIHLSTQANTTNSEAVKFWLNQGISRVVLARELNLEQIVTIRKKVPYAELEMFVHGAMCISYSGRCLLSKHMTDRSANKGECAQPCRWEYFIQETMREELMPIEEDRRGTYILNSKDLCMIEHIPELIAAGIDSFKIEGRMKSAYYVALVTKIYRQAIDAYALDPDNYKFLPEWQEELTKISHRHYTTGFYLKDEGMEYIADSAYVRGYDFVGVIEDFDETKRQAKIAVRNHFGVGDELEIIDPHQITIKPQKVAKIRRDNGEYINDAHNSYTVFLEMNNDFKKISSHSIVRRKCK